MNPPAKILLAAALLLGAHARAEFVRQDGHWQVKPGTTADVTPPSRLPVLLLAACDRDIGIVQNLETENFSPGENRPPADVVFVVDNSPSMSEEHARLATSLDLLLGRVVESGADMHVGVVTTDMTGDDAGMFLGGMFTVEDPQLSAHIAAAWLVASGRCANADDAVRAIQALTPGVVLNAAALL